MKKSELKALIAEIVQEAAKNAARQKSPKELTDFVRQLAREYDKENGGFGGEDAKKEPSPESKSDSKDEPEFSIKDEPSAKSMTIVSGLTFGKDKNKPKGKITFYIPGVETNPNKRRDNVKNKIDSFWDWLTKHEGTRTGRIPSEMLGWFDADEVIVYRGAAFLKNDEGTNLEYTFASAFPTVQYTGHAGFTSKKYNPALIAYVEAEYENDFKKLAKARIDLVRIGVDIHKSAQEIRRDIQRVRAQYKDFRYGKDAKEYEAALTAYAKNKNDKEAGKKMLQFSKKLNKSRDDIKRDLQNARKKLQQSVPQPSASGPTTIPEQTYMKKSELKALIREVIEEVQGNELNQMINALENNPEFVDAAMEKYGDRLNEEDMNRRSFIGKLAKVLVGAGIAASAVSTAKADGITDIIRWGDQQIANFEKMNKDQMEKLGMKSPEAVEGSVRDLHNKHKKQGAFKKYREDYLTALDDNDPSKAIENSERIQKTSIQHAWNLIKTASDYDEYNQKGFIPSVVAGITSFGVKTVAETMKSDPRYKDVKIPDSVLK